jgi:hypothetical protein
LFAVRQGKNDGKLFSAERFFRRALVGGRTVELLFAVRPKKCARQSSKRTAKREFPVVMV